MQKDDERGLPFDLWTACSVGDLECVREILSAQSDDEGIENRLEINTLNLGGWSGLMYASYYDHSKLVAFLVSCGCDPSQKSRTKEKTALMLAASCGHCDVVKTLLRITDPDRVLADKDARGFDALFHAVSSGHFQVCDVLLTSKSDPNVTEHNRGLSPLLLAAEAGHERIVELLLRHGADPCYKTPAGDSAKTLALRRGNDRMANLVESKKPRRVTSACPGVWDGPQRATLLMEQQHQKRVSSILASLDLDKYQGHFKDVTYDQFLGLTDEDLKRLGINLLGPRRKLTATIDRFNQSQK